MRLTKLAELINEQFPQWEARVENSSYTISPPTHKGSRIVKYHRTRHGKALRVYERGKAFMRPVYECNLACWYKRAGDAVRWFTEQGGKLPAHPIP